MFVGDSLIAQYASPSSVQDALQRLGQAGFPVENLSLVTRAPEDAKQSFASSMGVRMKTAHDASHDPHAVLPGGTLFSMPDLGHLLIAGPLVNSILTRPGAAEPTGSAGAVFAGLLSIGVQAESIPAYESALRAGKCLLLAHGTSDEVGRAEQIIGGTRHRAYTVHGAAVIKRPYLSTTYCADKGLPGDRAHQQPSPGDAAYPAFYSSPLS